MQNLRKHICLPMITLVLVLALTGCIRVNLDITIKSNGKADISFLYAFQDSLTSMMDDGEGVGMSAEEVEEYRTEGWEVKDYAAEGYTGYIISKENVDLSETDLMEGSEGRIRKEGSLYIVDIELFSENDRKSFTESASMLKSMGGSFTVHLTLPVKPVKHNATSVSDDGKTLEWDIFSMNVAEPIHVEFRTVNYALIIAIVAAIAVAVAAVGIISRRRAKAKKEEMDSAFEGGSPEESALFTATSTEEDYVADQSDKTTPEDPASEISKSVREPAEGEIRGSIETSQDTAQPTTQKICKTCGNVLSDGNIFCPICGTKVEPGDNE